ncbi:sigma factor regulator VreR [Aliidongia dinghuensis]|uniref:Sigma factor regulator VreR n=1 Tax=Aliidongia dinghuensis TaxID=1867774 RepID=A0A8J3E5F1_9PROT|nr:FecR domain-containing protein [Aliidongia dinghuensis]GGF46903.1 sigma factor regulator VreR [Aliidongia dinghuensis]
MTAMDETTTDELNSEDDALRREAKDWVVHVATGPVTKGDLKALARWRAQSPKHAEAYARAAGLWQALGEPLEAAERVPRQDPVGRSANARRPLGRRAFVGGALAASAAAGLAVAYPPFGLWPSLGELTAQYRTGTGEQRQIALGDRSSVELNTRTSLDIRQSVEADSIELIAGEAALAAGAKPLAVHALEGRTSAIEAQFTVRCDGPVVRVTCLAGSVAVTYRGDTARILPKQQVAYAAASGLGSVTPVDPEIVAGWRDGLLVFDNETLSQVIEEVNRYRPGHIILVNAALGGRRISGRFKIARLDAVLTQFQAVFGAKVTSLPGGFVLLG